MSLGRSVGISKALSEVLRHKAMEFGINIRSDGYCCLREVLAVKGLQRLACTEEEVDEIVRTNDKRRFEFNNEDGMLLIRAVQGHSMKAVSDHNLFRRLSENDMNHLTVVFMAHTGGITTASCMRV